MSLNTITVMYTCRECQLLAREIVVTERALHEDAVQFVERIGNAAGADHMRVNPNCPCRQVDIQIPLFPGSTHLGRRPRH